MAERSLLQNAAIALVIVIIVMAFFAFPDYVSLPRISSYGLFDIFVIALLFVLLYVLFRPTKESKKTEGKEEEQPAKSNDTNFIFLFILAIVGRIVLAPLGTAAPIIPIAVYTGLKIGPFAGLAMGALAFPAANLLVGKFWQFFTWIEATMGGIAGFFPRAISKNVTSENLVFYTFVFTVVYELITKWYVNPSLLYLYSQFYFSTIHIAINTIVAGLLGIFMKK